MRIFLTTEKPIDFAGEKISKLEAMKSRTSLGEFFRVARSVCVCV